MEKNKDRVQQHKQANLFGFATLSTWLHLLRENRGVDKEYKVKMMNLVVLSILTAPLRIYERLRYGCVIAKVKIQPSPVFILGHYRSGTTFLHNLMSQDSSFGYVSTFQAIAAPFSITGSGKIKDKLAAMVPEKRSMDNMKSSLDLPQEEEIGIACLCPYSFMHQMGFPRKSDEYIDKYLLLETISPKELNIRKAVFLLMLKKATYLSGGKRLLLKNPVNTAQVRFLLNLFPDAKFIHIHRNPYEVFSSTLLTGGALKEAHVFQNFSDEKGIDIAFTAYKKMMKKFLAEKHLIPKDNFAEVSYEELNQHPVDVLAHIYSHLHLPDFEKHKPVFEAYVKSLGQYKSNRLKLTPEYLKRINEEWGFALDEWKYPRLKNGSITENQTN